MNKKDILKEKFRKREGFGVCGSYLPTIAKTIAELYGSKHIQINLPYNGFNCKGTANKVAKDVCGVMPFAKEKVEMKDTTTLFYDNIIVNKASYYLPFLSECDVFFIESITTINKVLVVNLMKAPSWREYL